MAYSVSPRMSLRTMTLVACLGVPLWDGTAFAQANGPNAEEPPTAAPSHDLEEIVVTAEKRSENVQNVPIAITAITADFAKAMGIDATTDLQVATPGLIMHTQANALTPSLRGISQSSAANGDESPIAIYVDGVYIASMNAGLFSFNSIDRVEVLKGPQGTLFGRNAAGGVIQVINKAPSETPSADVQLTYGNYDTYGANLYATGGVAPKLAADFAAYVNRQSDGWGTNVTTGLPTYRNNETAARTSWLWTPDDKTAVTLAADYDLSHNPMGIVKSPLPGTLSVFGQSHEGGFYDVQENTESGVRETQWGSSIHIRRDLDWANLVSISAYRHSSTYTNIDQDGTSLPFVVVSFPQSDGTVTQEFQLLSADSSPVHWILGAFYLDSTAALAQSETGTAVGALEFVDIDDTLYTNSYAAFGQATATILPDTHLTLGARYTLDRQRITGEEYTTHGGIASTAADQDKQWGAPTWRIALDHQFTDQVMAYVSDDRGFKSGVYNTSAVPTLPPVNPEKIDAYEVGVKSEFLDHTLRLNSSAFYYKVSDLQLTVSIPGSSLLQNAASADIKGLDLDGQLYPINHLRIGAALSLLDPKFTSFPNAVFVAPKAGGGYTTFAQSAAGNDLPYSPKWTSSINSDYEIPTSIGKYSISLLYYHNGGYFFDSANQFPERAYNVVDASIAWFDPRDVWSVKLWGKNLTGSEYYTQEIVSALGALGTPGAPRTYGITVEAKF